MIMSVCALDIVPEADTGCASVRVVLQSPTGIKVTVELKSRRALSDCERVFAFGSFHEVLITKWSGDNA